MILVRAALCTILVPGAIWGFLPHVIAQRWPEPLLLMALFGTDALLKTVNAFMDWVIPRFL